MAKKKVSPLGPEPMGEMLDLKEAADFLKVSKPTFYRWLAQGKIKGAKVGQQWRFQRADLERFLQSDPTALPAEVQGFRAAVNADRATRNLGPFPWPEGAEADGDIPQFVFALLEDAVRSMASDIHVDPDRDAARVRYRIDGVLQEVLSFPKEAAKAVVARCKLLADCDINERRLPQNGRIRVSIENREYDFRLTTVPAIYGESMIMRILDQGSVLIGLDRLGMSESMRATFEERLTVPQGLVVVVGPAGSGRTTTVYSALNLLNDPKRKIVTIEDPVEYALRGMMQVYVNRKAGLLPAGALRTFMRCDPDIVMLYELRDLETAEQCVTAAMTGHLVFTTLLGSDAASAVTRLIEMGLEPFLTASALSTVVAQRLVRRICPDCKAPYSPSAELRRRVEAETGLDLSGKTFHRGAGCATCRQTGYKGRTGLFEVMVITEALREMIARPVSTAALRQAAREAGLVTILQDGVQKAAAGITTLEEVLRVLVSAY